MSEKKSGGILQRINNRKLDNNNNIDIKQRDKRRFWKGILVTIMASLVSSLALYVFVYPANFVPLGLEAVATMLLQVWNQPWFWTLLLNAPLIIYACFKLDRRYVFFSLLFTALSSLFLFVYPIINLPVYNKPDERLLAAICSGIMLGIRTGLMLRIGSSSGGVDIIAQVLGKRFPQVNIERIITVICCTLIFGSYFVYRDFDCILLGMVQMFISERATTFLMRQNREAIKVEIVTKTPEKLKEDIIVNLRHSATVIDGKGLYSGEANTVLFVVLNLYQMADFINIIKKYPDTFVYYYDVKGVYGNFRRFRDEIVK